MKKLLILFLTLVMSVSAFGLIACGEDKKESQSHTHNFINGQCSCGEYEPTFRTEGLIFSLINNGTEYKVKGYIGTSTEVIIPSTYEGKPVTSIDHWAFSDCESLTSIVIPNSVTSIGQYAFYSCYNLTSIVIPNSVKAIGDYAFSNCDSLTSIVIPNSVEAIGYDAFDDCYSLQYNIEGNLKYLGNSKNPYLYLAGTTSYDITSATINANCKIIGYRAFYNCESLTSIVIPNSVEAIGDYAFSYCYNLTSIVIPNSVEVIGVCAFYECDSLTSIVIPESVEAIGYVAFSGCDSLTIYCEIEESEKPSGWHARWNPDNRPVVWGYKG